MEDNTDRRNDDRRSEEIFSKRVRAGKRTYFFDVKTTRSNENYLTITESKRFLKGEEYYYEKHKIFLYKEDFGKFADALLEAMEFVKETDGDDFELPSFENVRFRSEREEGLVLPEEESGFNEELKWD